MHTTEMPPKQSKESLFRQLVDACENGDLVKATHAVANGVDVNKITPDAKTPLYIAVEHNKKNIVDYLLSQGALADKLNGAFKWSALQQACINDNFPIVQSLVDSGADVNFKEKSDYSSSPLLLATKHRNQTIIDFLLSKGAIVDERIKKATMHNMLLDACKSGDLAKVTQVITDGVGADWGSYIGMEYPLFIAVSNNHKDIVEYLLTKHVDINSQNGIGKGHTALYQACMDGFLDIVKVLVDAGADMNLKTFAKFTPLYVAVQNKHMPVVTYLLTKGVNIDEKNGDKERTILQQACYDGDLDIVKLLVDSGANINLKTKEEFTPLFIAVRKNHISIVEYLLSKGANINEQNGQYGQTALYSACSLGSLDILKLLVDAGANMNLKSDQGYTPLFIAVQIKNAPVVEYLISKGVDVDEKNGLNDYTALIKASLDGSFDIAKMLVEAGANVNYITLNKNTPLVASVTLNNKSIVEYLLSKGANINIKTTADELSLLHIASMGGFLDIVKILVDAGADLKIGDKHGRTPLDLAKHNKHAAVVEYLESLMPIAKWKGFTRSDISKFDTIFGDDAINVATCPICLKYVERSDACMYMTHTCTALGGFYHPDLYNKYKNAAGQISWCTICGRICVGHNHYKLGFAVDAKPAVIATAHDPFSKDCRDANGGGGLPEKFARFRRMREIALELQEFVGTMREEDALKALIEETWNAPLNRSFKIPKIMAERKWNIPTNEFPPNAAPLENAPVANYNNPTAYQPPIVRAPGTNNYQGNMITLDDTEPVIQFKHKKADGTMNESHNQISLTSLIHYLDNAGAVKGKCFDDTCGGLLWPKEIELAFADPALGVTDVQKGRLAVYKERFNTWHAEGAVGGKHRR